MIHPQRHGVRCVTALCSALAAILFASSPAPAQVGDRQLLRTSVGDAYVMILLDTSGSMNWAPKCTAQQVATGVCSYLCPNGDCPVPRDGDDPASKFRQAKEALYEVIQKINGIHYGLATYNQDSLRVQHKEWLYRVSATQSGGFVTLNSGAQFPSAGSDEVLGATFGCARGGGDGNIGCYANGNDAADTNDVWEMTKVRRLPKLGEAQNEGVVYFIRDSNQVYRVEVENPSGVSQTLGDPTMSLRFLVYRCTGSPSNNPSDKCDNGSGRHAEYTLLSGGDKTIQYDLQGDFVKWDYTVSRNSSEGGYDGVVWSDASNTCGGWDPNDDTNNDVYGGYDLRYPTTGTTYDPPGTANDHYFTVGDVLPLDWNSDNKSAILNRLAPRLNGGDPATDPEAFANATYLNSQPSSGQSYLRLKNEAQRPLLPNGSTPLGYALADIRSWFRGCENGTCPHSTGWSDIAAAQDPSWQCRKKFLLVVTDGDDTCPGRDPCSFTASMHALDDITTYVIAFGVQNTSGNKLTCMAKNGGSGDPIYPQNKQELVDSLTKILGEIQESTVAFASAAVPTVQTNIFDKIYLSSFTPLNGEAIWPGRLDSFLKPLPVDPTTGLPMRSPECSDTSPFIVSGCWAWDAGDSQPAWNTDGSGYTPRGFLLQTPLESDITRFNNSTLKVGTDPDQRRIYFGLPDSTTVSGKRQYFRFPQDPQINPLEQANFEYAWNLPISTPGTVGSTDNRNTIADVVEFTLEQKQGEIDNPLDSANPFHVQYVLGDIFHSNPIVVNPPNDFEYFSKNLFWNMPLCGQTVAETEQRGPSLSYQYFSDKNLCRRVMVFFGSDDGQLHAYDGGTFGADSGARNPSNAGQGPYCKLDSVPNSTPGASALAGTGIKGEYNFGTGRELFSFIPNQMMPVVKELSTISELSSQYGIDGSVRVGDVFIDPAPGVDPVTGLVSPTCVNREWRTVLIGSYREGGPGIFSLDITQPDAIGSSDNVPRALAGTPSYVPSCADGGTGCGLLPFPALKWEFRDPDENGVPWTDDDANGQADMANSWSRPVIVRMSVCNGECSDVNLPEDRFVAIFGGGVSPSPSNSAADTTGNWLYIVDIETGRLLYKRGGTGAGAVGHPIVGAVPSDVTAVDFNANGYVDTLYFGTTAGYVYKVELGDGPFSTDPLTGRIVDPQTGAGTVDAGALDPFQVFSTDGRPIYLEIDAVYVPKMRATALLFGTGNRWNLWSVTGVGGRFYALVDQNWQDTNRDGVMDSMNATCASCSYPLVESYFPAIDPNDNTTPVANYLYGAVADKLAGWYLTLDASDKLITEASTLSGVSFFTVFSPVESETAGTCAFGGESKIFVVNTVTTAGYAIPAGSSTRARYTVAPTFTTQPYVEPSGTKNPPSAGSTTNADQWTSELAQINADLKKLLGPTCRFANYSLDIRTIRSDTGVVFIAPVPVCLNGHDWKEY